MINNINEKKEISEEEGKEIEKKVKENFKFVISTLKNISDIVEERLEEKKISDGLVIDMKEYDLCEEDNEFQIISHGDLEEVMSESLNNIEKKNENSSKSNDGIEKEKAMSKMLLDEIKLQKIEMKRK